MQPLSPSVSLLSPFPRTQAEVRSGLEPRFQAWKKAHVYPVDASRKTASLEILAAKDSLVPATAAFDKTFPDDVLLTIFYRMEVNQLIPCRTVCRQWKKIIDQRSFFWTKIEQMMIERAYPPSLIQGFKSVSNIQTLPFVSPDLFPLKTNNQTILWLKERKINIVRTIDRRGRHALGFLLYDLKKKDLVFALIQEKSILPCREKEKLEVNTPETPWKCKSTAKSTPFKGEIYVKGPFVDEFLEKYRQDIQLKLNWLVLKSQPIPLKNPLADSNKRFSLYIS